MFALAPIHSRREKATRHRPDEISHQGQINNGRSFVTTRFERGEGEFRGNQDQAEESDRGDTEIGCNHCHSKTQPPDQPNFPVRV